MGVLTKVLVFEDALNGVEAALSAGMPIFWVPDPQCQGIDDSSLRDQVMFFLRSLDDIMSGNVWTTAVQILAVNFMRRCFL